MEQQRPTPTKTGKLKLNRQVFVFSVCLVISFFIWLQFNLSKINHDVVPVYVELEKPIIPLKSNNCLVDTLYLEVEADGFSLIQYEPLTMTLDASRARKQGELYYLLPAKHQKTINKQMGDEFQLVRIVTDTLFIRLKNK